MSDVRILLRAPLYPYSEEKITTVFETVIAGLIPARDAINIHIGRFLFMSDEKDIDLRDQFAIAAMQSLVRNYNQLLVTYTNKLPTTITGIQQAEEIMPIIATLAYKIADHMRKERLKSFT